MAKQSFQKKNRKQIIFSSCAKMILSFSSKHPYLLSLSQYINTLQYLAITNLCPLWQEFLLLSKQLICQNWHDEMQPWAYKTWMQGGGNGSLLTVQLLCFNAEVWHCQSHTCAVLLPPCCVCWRPVSTWKLLTLPPDQGAPSSSGTRAWQRSGWGKKNKTGKCLFCE